MIELLIVDLDCGVRELCHRLLARHLTKETCKVRCLSNVCPMDPSQDQEWIWMGHWGLPRSEIELYWVRGFTFACRSRCAETGTNGIVASNVPPKVLLPPLLRLCHPLPPPGGQRATLRRNGLYPNHPAAGAQHPDGASADLEKKSRCYGCSIVSIVP